jgi:dephospho-CoA kinase
MLVIGLTGSIGMGKSTVAAHLRARGIPVYDADAEVHELYRGEAAPLIEAAFPGTTRNGQVDRMALSRILLEAPHRMAELEAIVHPLVRNVQKAFLERAAKAGHRIAVVEIPLLFETGGEKRVDVTVVVSAPAAVQRERVLARPGMTAEKLERLLARQMPDAEKRRRADFVVETEGTIAETQAQVDRLLESLERREGERTRR